MHKENNIYVVRIKKKTRWPKAGHLPLSVLSVLPYQITSSFTMLLYLFFLLMNSVHAFLRRCLHPMLYTWHTMFIYVNNHIRGPFRHGTVNHACSVCLCSRSLFDCCTEYIHGRLYILSILHDAVSVHTASMLRSSDFHSSLSFAHLRIDNWTEYIAHLPHKGFQHYVCIEHQLRIPNHQTRYNGILESLNVDRECG